MADFLAKVRANKINERYSLVCKLGEGGFGAVYLGKDEIDGGQVALKLEHQKHEEYTLRSEYAIYSDLQSLVGFPKIYWYGEHDEYRVMAFELLGPSLTDLLDFCGGKFSLKTTLMLADQVLQRLESLNKGGYFHRDMKPENILLGSGTKANIVYIIDFGLGQLIPTHPVAVTRDGRDPSRSFLVGTPRYASIRGHLGQPQTPLDDIEALGYMMLYFLRGRLPWQGLDRTDRDNNVAQHLAILKMKEETTEDELCAGLPRELADFLRQVRDPEATPHQRPDYAALRGLLARAARREGIVYDNVFDWTIKIFLDRKAGLEVEPSNDE